MNTPDVHWTLLPHAEALFFPVARASLLGGCAIVLVMALRFTCGRRLAPSFRLGLWMPAMVLLLLPRLPDLGLKMPSSATAPAPVVSSKSDAASVIDTSAPLQEIESMAVPAASAPFSVSTTSIPETKTASLPAAWSLIAALAWIMVMFALACGCVFAHFAWRRRVLRLAHTPSDTLLDLFTSCCRSLGLHRTPHLVVSRALDNPVVTGLVRPRVVVPSGLESALPPAELRHVLLHEAAHVHRRDLWWQWAWFAVLALHWFNPLVWLAMRFARADREAACDATALAALPGDGRHAYGTTLLRIQERLTRFAAPLFTPGAAGSTDLLRERILDISHHGRRSPHAGGAALTVMILGASLIAVLAAAPPEPVPSAEAAPPRAPVAATVIPDGTAICRMRMEFVKPDVEDGEKLVEDYMKEQMDLLQAPGLREKAQQRAKALRPTVDPVPVTVTAERVPGAYKVHVMASGPSSPYIGRYLASFMAVLAENRKEVTVWSPTQTPDARLKELKSTADLLKEMTERIDRAADPAERGRVMDEFKLHFDRRSKIAGMQRWSCHWIEEVTSSPDKAAGKTSTKMVSLRDDVVIDVGKDGKPEIGGETLSQEELLASLKARFSFRRDQHVILRAAPDCQYKDVVAVLQVCQKAGIWNVAIADGDGSGPAAGWCASRAVIDVGQLPEEQKARLQDEFIGTQAEILRSPTMGTKVEARLKATHPQLTPEPVTITVERSPGTNRLAITATATSEAYVQVYLDGLLEETMALRAELRSKSIVGTVDKVRKEIQERERQVKDAKEKLEAAIKQIAADEKLAKLKAELITATENLQSWTAKLQHLEESASKHRSAHEIRVIERASPAKAGGPAPR